MVHGFLVPMRVAVGTVVQVYLIEILSLFFSLGKLLENFWKNPQYLVTVSLADDGNRDQLCTMIIFLMLKIPHERRLRHGEDQICFQFRVYKVSRFKEQKSRFLTHKN
jgi:hypothetical protein